MLRECFQHLGTLERKRISTAPNVVLRLNRGERVEPLPRDLLTAMTYAVRASSIQQYPDYAPFYTRLGLHVGMPPSQLVVGAGIEEFIRTLMFLCCEPKERVAVLWPTCAMYEIYSRAFGLRLMKMLTEPGTQTPMSSLIHVFMAVGPLRLWCAHGPGADTALGACARPAHVLQVLRGCGPTGGIRDGAGAYDQGTPRRASIRRDHRPLAGYGDRSDG